MCLILFCYQPGADRPLVLGANRDEFFARPTANAHYWEESPKVLAGRDLQAGGTWLGITTNGRFAAVTNVRESDQSHKELRSRGSLTREFLQGTQPPLNFLESIEQDHYAGFNLLVGDFSSQHPCLYYLSNRHPGIQELSNGTYGLSNELLDSPWPKVNDGKAVLRQRINQADGNHASIRDILEHPITAEDHLLPSTGVSYEQEKALSAIFIASLSDYGTRTSTVLTIEQNRIEFSEQNYQASATGEPNPLGETQHFVFDTYQHSTAVATSAISFKK